jgi:ribosomal protein L25 (general stress protein Ctc)
MEELKLTVTRRDVLGKRNRFLRRQGQTPAHLFGHSIESLPLQCDAVVLKNIIDRAGHTRLVNLLVKGEKAARTVFVREIQRDVLNKYLVHFDFYQCAATRR